MTIAYIQELLSQIENIKVIDKVQELDGVIYHIMGLVKKESTIQILILHYDKHAANITEESEPIMAEDRAHITKSNRAILKSSKISDKNLILGARKLITDDKEYEISLGESTSCTMDDPYYVMLITKFLLSGWNALGIDYWNINFIHLTTLTLAGEYKSITDISYESKIQLIIVPNSTSHLVEQEITLSIGNQYPDKIYFKDQLTGEVHWVQINQVYLYDVWARTLEMFDSSELQNNVPANELTQIKEKMKLDLRKICPEGMLFPLIEYECEDKIFLQFYINDWLDYTHNVSNDSSMGFIITSENPIGILGTMLKSALIQAPMPSQTTRINAEIFEYKKLSKEIITFE